MPGGVQRLDAVAGAEVEQRADRAAAGRADQAERRVPDAEDVILRHGVAQQVGVQIGHHPPGTVLVAVRALHWTRALDLRTAG